MSTDSSSTLSLWHKIPGATKASTVVAVLGFLVSLTSYSVSTENGVRTACSYVDFGAMLWALVVATTAFAGLRANATRHREDANRLPQTVMLLVTGALFALAVIHGLRGFGVIGGRC